jgi:hypothetical protein
MSESEQPKNLVEEMLAKLGLKSALAKITKGKKAFPKLKVAYARYGFIKTDQVEAFQRKLGIEKSKRAGYYKKLSFTSLERYDRDVPPMDVLKKIEEAKAVGCFDSFEIAYIEEVKKDPIVFGRIDGCTDRFFIAQWDNDVSIEQIIMAAEEAKK